MTDDGFDVISAGGDDRPPMQVNPKIRLIAIAVAIVALVGYAATRVIGAREDPAVAVPAATTSPSPSPTPVAASSSFTSTGQPLGMSTSTRLLLAGEQTVSATVDAGTALRADIPPGRVERALAVRGGHALLIRAPAGDATAVFLPDDGSPAHTIGAANALFAAADDDSVWFAFERSAVGEIRRYDVVQRAVVDKADLGRDRRAIRETPLGLLTVSTKYYSSLLELYDLRTRQVRETYFAAASFVVHAANETHAVYTLPQCALPACPVKVMDLETAQELNLQVPDGWATDAVAFAPDGRHLAIIGRAAGKSAVSTPALLVAHADDGRVRRVEGVDAGEGAFSLLGWSPDSRWLFAARRGPFDALLAHRRGEANVRYVARPEAFAVRGPLTALAAY